MQFTDFMLTAVKAEIEAADPSLVGKVTTSFPTLQRALDSLNIVIDRVNGEMRHSLNGIIRDETWVRIWVVASKKSTVNATADIIMKAMIESDTMFVQKVNGVSPLLPAFEEKDLVWQRNFDVQIKSFRSSDHIYNFQGSWVDDEEVDGGIP